MNHNDSNVTIISSHLLSDPLKGYCLQSPFRKVLEEQAPKLLGNPERRFILDRRYYCGGLCDEGEYYDEEAKKCKQKTTRIYYVNGVWNTYENAKDNKELLIKAHRSSLEQEFKKEMFEFDVGYNYSYGTVKDLLEVIAQKQKELNDPEDNLSPHELLTLYMTVSDINISYPIVKTVEEYLAARISEQFTLSELIGKMNADFIDGKRLILIAHSQGNLFANQIMQIYESDPKYNGSIAMIGLASPAGAVYNRTVYWTAYDDRIINALRVKFSNTVLPANIDNDTGFFDGRGLSNHNFDTAYFKTGLPSRTNMDVAFKAFIYTLKFPNEKK
jgi:hypothetical protein